MNFKSGYPRPNFEATAASTAPSKHLMLCMFGPPGTSQRKTGRSFVKNSGMDNGKSLTRRIIVESENDYGGKPYSKPGGGKIWTLMKS